MTGSVLNGLRRERERRGWSQARMAGAGGVSRQSYAAIEAGRSVPSTEVALRLARALGRPVEELFRLAERPAERERAAWAGGSPPAVGQAVRLATVAGRRTAHPVGEAYRPAARADGVVEEVAGSEVGVRLLECPPGRTDLVVVGCDPAVGIVADTLRTERGIDSVWSPRGSRAALRALARGDAHVAGTHLQDPASGEWNGPWIRDLVPFPTTRVRFAVWEQGLLARPGGRRPIRDVADLARPDVRILNREEGSGSRMLLDERLEAAGVRARDVAGYHTAARGHEAVAEGVASGAADAGVATRAAATALALAFTPLREDVYELVVPDHFLELPAVGALLDALRRPGVRRQVEALQGYDADGMGRGTG